MDNTLKINKVAEDIIELLSEYSDKKQIEQFKEIFEQIQICIILYVIFLKLE